MQKKSIIQIATLVFLINAVRAQQLPPAYNVTEVNQVLEWAPTSPQTGSPALSLLSLREVKTTTRFIDGLGRTVQSVMKKGSLVTDPANLTSSANAVDIVSAKVYDPFGRETAEFLPFASNSTGGNSNINNGLFKANPFQQQKTFYEDPAGILKGQGETWFYSQTNYEASPLQRVEKTLPAGNSWVGGGRGTEVKYFLNTVTDDVRKWTVTDVTGTFGTYAEAGAYPASVLYKNVIVDEHGKQVIEFHDKEGKIILKKSQLTATADNGSGSGYDNWACSYYVYDGTGNLRCVIQPEGVKALIPNGWAMTTTLLNEQCFRYEYDERGRMIMKKVPGSGDVYMVYDARDRVVMMQDANMRTAPAKWLVTKYDVLNRPIETGLWTDASGADIHRSNASTSTSYPVTSSNYELLSINHYDDYSSIPGGLTAGYDNTWASYFNSTYNTAPDYAQQAALLTQPNGLVTWTQTKVLGTTSTFLYTVNIYNDKGRILQVKSTNVTSGTDISTIQYNWSGQPLITVRYREKGGVGAQITTTITKMTYDDLGRAVRVEQRLSNNLVNGNVMSPYKVIAENEFDALGHLKKKKIAPAYNGIGLETENFDYNIRGWLLGMNRDYAKDANNTNYFGFDLGYDKANNNIMGGQTYATPQFNGNIEGMVWKSKGDGEKRKYDFTYDALNRLTAADFNQYTGGNFNKNANIDFSVSNLSFDANGNILTMNQKGWKGGSSPLIDQLTYSYLSNSNRLAKVTDGMNDPASKLGDFKDGANGTSDDYSYDANGNLSLDNNKAISSITYNHLNQPFVVTIPGKGTIAYTYDAAGIKLRKTTVDNTIAGKTITRIITYAGEMVYESRTTSPANTPNDDYTDVLQFIGNSEGRIRFNPALGTVAANFQYDYFLKDHLGNVRMMLTEEQQQDQYPAATLEGSAAPGATSMINYEKQFYSINDAYAVDKALMPGFTSGMDYQNNNGNPPLNQNYPGGTTPSSTTISGKVYKLNATTNKTGLGIVLKVMAGDKIDIHGKSYYQSSNSFDNNNSTLLLLSDVINAFLGAPDNAGFAAKGISSSTMQSLNNGLIPANFFRGADGTTATSPKAYINYIFFDEQFKYAGGGFSRVGNSGTVKNHWFEDAGLQNIPVPKNGYLYVYVSNESNENVFFDNLQVFHTRGPILEETHYYPFGLTMAGISSKAAGKTENRFKFNAGTELNRDLDLNLYETENRLYDPQIGRFWQTDDLAEGSWEWTPYNFGEDNPICYNDPQGLEAANFENTGKKRRYSPTKDGNYAEILDYVFVVAKITRTQQRIEDIYWDLQNKGKPISSVEDPNLRWRLYRQDQVEKFIAKVHEDIRTEGYIALEIGSWFIPMGWVTKVRYLRYASYLFKLKRVRAVLNATRAIFSHSKQVLKVTEEVIAHERTLEKGAKVYRAVGKTEMASLKSSEQFALVEGGTEVKYFARTAEDAEWYGQKLKPDGFTIVESTVHESVNVAEYWHPYVDIGTYAFPKEVLPFIKPHL